VDSEDSEDSDGEGQPKAKVRKVGRGDVAEAGKKKSKSKGLPTISSSTLANFYFPPADLQECASFSSSDGSSSSDNSPSPSPSEEEEGGGLVVDGGIVVVGGFVTSEEGDTSYVYLLIDMETTGQPKMINRMIALAARFLNCYGAPIGKDYEQLFWVEEPLNQLVARISHRLTKKRDPDAVTGLGARRAGQNPRRPGTQAGWMRSMRRR
tara:strand:- start:414 stop:1040 length:627 start_codon:yes stop_codon:yes gene_type:complete